METLSTEAKTLLAIFGMISVIVKPARMMLVMMRIIAPKGEVLHKRRSKRSTKKEIPRLIYLENPQESLTFMSSMVTSHLQNSTFLLLTSQINHLQSRHVTRKQLSTSTKKNLPKNQNPFGCPMYQILLCQSLIICLTRPPLTSLKISPIGRF